MKKIILTTIFVAAASVAAAAQGVMPAGASDKNLDDRNIKDRSMEIERIRRDANKPGAAKTANEQAQQLRFAEIKEDFEKIQTLQGGIVEAYTKGKQIDYARIAAQADEMNRSGARLNGNLFAAPAAEEEPKDKKKKDKKKDAAATPAAATPDAAAEKPVPAGVRELIVELDNTLAAFTANPMFTNPQVVNAADNARAKSDLERVIKLSAALKVEAENQKK